VLLADKLGPEAFERVAADPVAFVRAFDKRQPWPFQEGALRAVSERRDGRLLHPIGVVSWPRQDSKSTLSAWIGAWRLFCDEPSEEVVSVALDRDSARVIHGAARRLIRGSRILSGLLDKDGDTRDELRLRDGRRWLVKSSEAALSRGLSPATICFDELGWTTDDGALFEVLSAAQGAQEDPLLLVTSTVGPVQVGPLWRLFERAREGDPEVLLLYSNANQSPLVTQKYLDRQRSILPPSVYLREHENRWGVGTDVYCTEEDWRRATSQGDPRQSTGQGCVIYVDLGWVHDESALAVAKSLGEGKADVLHLEGFKPAGGATLSLSAVEDRIVELVEAYGARVAVESPQGVLMVERLRARNVKAEALHPTSKSNREHWGALYTALKRGTVRLPNDATLRRQLLTLTIQDSVTGWRVVDEPSIHNDRAVAVAGALFMAATARPRGAQLVGFLKDDGGAQSGTRALLQEAEKVGGEK
jgi:hypothetical protein